MRRRPVERLSELSGEGTGRISEELERVQRPAARLLQPRLYPVLLRQALLQGPRFASGGSEVQQVAKSYHSEVDGCLRVLQPGLLRGTHPGWLTPEDIAD